MVGGGGLELKGLGLKGSEMKVLEYKGFRGEMFGG